MMPKSAGSLAPRKKRPRHVVVGDLRFETGFLTSEIQSAIVGGEHLVWADEDHTVFVSRGEPPPVPDHWIIGTYMMGTSSSGIAQDVAAMWQERSKNFIID